MNCSLLLVPILAPAIGGVIALALGRWVRGLGAAAAIVVSAAALVAAGGLYGRDIPAQPFDWAGFGIDFSLRLDHFSGLMLVAVAGFGFLVSLYSLSFMAGKPSAWQYYGYLCLSVGFSAGAVLADNLVLLLFFWEGLLGVTFGLIAIGRPGAWRTAVKMLIIVGVTDVCLMFGIALTGLRAHSLSMSAIASAHLPLDATGVAAFVLLMIGAVAKGGSMPFHSWIPDAAVDAPLPFMAVLPASIEKILGIYLLARVTLDLYPLAQGSGLSILLMAVGAVTIVLAVSMALVQKDYKRLLSYHAISQLGYMVLGIGTAVPAGVIGGLFHMVNNALYKSCLFLTGGSVERQAGTTDLNRLGGIAGRMPVTFLCFLVSAFAISGAWPLNGFFSKELVYDGCLHAGVPGGAFFYAAALLGSFLTAASFLKLGHAAFLGPRDASLDNVKESPLPMLVPMVVLAAVCVLFGVHNTLPLNLLAPVLGEGAAHQHFGGLVPENGLLVILSAAMLLGALANHLYGTRVTGRGLHAVDHIHHAPVLQVIYDHAEKRHLDPYDLGRHVVGWVSRALWAADVAVDWVYDRACASLARACGAGLRAAHNGNTSWYVVWCAAGAALVVFVVLMF